MADIRPVIRGDDRRSLTYAEIAAARGISADSAVRLVRADVERDRADRAEQKAAGLQTELIDLLISERSAVELAEYASAEVADLRRRLEAAEEERSRLTGQQELERTRTDQAERRTHEERERADAECNRADQAERRLADKDATITGLVAEQQAMRQQVETLTELLKTRRSWWGRVFGGRSRRRG